MFFRIPILLCTISLVGCSSVVSSYISSQLNLRNDTDGLVLQAPVVVFDQAVVNYANAYSPFYSSFIPDSSIRTGAAKALKDADVRLEQRAG
jgi:hypothetical protein